MNIEEKRNLLEVFCEKRHDCVSCPLKDEAPVDYCDFFDCSNNDVEKAYNLVFGSEEPKYMLNCENCQFCECADFDFPCKDCTNNYGGSRLKNYFNPINSGAIPEEINHPDRYAGGKFECIDVMQDVFGADTVKHFCILNAFKYIWRSEKKNGVEDIKKAVWYLNKYIELGGDE